MERDWDEIIQWDNMDTPSLVFTPEHCKLESYFSTGAPDDPTDSLFLYGEVDRTWSDLDINSNFNASLSGTVQRLPETHESGDNGDSHLKFSERNFRQSKTLVIGFRALLSALEFDRFLSRISFCFQTGGMLPKITVIALLNQGNREDFWRGNHDTNQVPILKLKIGEP